MVGRKAEMLNGVYERMSDPYNGKPLFRKRNDPGYSVYLFYLLYLLYLLYEYQKRAASTATSRFFPAINRCSV